MLVTHKPYDWISQGREIVGFMKNNTFSVVLFFFAYVIFLFDL